MTTVALLQKLKTIAETNPSALSDFDWGEVSQCLRAELSCSEGLYTEDQFYELSGLFSRLSGRLSKAAAAGDAAGIATLLSEGVGIAEALPSSESASLTLMQAAFDHAALRHYQKDTTVVIGDSHVNFFSSHELLTFQPIGDGVNVCPPADDAFPFTALHFGGCLAYTCQKPHTSMGFHDKLPRILTDFVRPGARLLLSLGEIDLRVHVLPQAEAQNRPAEAVIEDVIAPYLSLLTSLKSQGFWPYVWGPIASQADDTPQDPAFPRFGSETERNHATAVFTEKLTARCSAEDIPVISIFPEMVTPTLHTKTEYLSSDLFHLGQRAMTLALPKLAAAGLLSAP